MRDYLRGLFDAASEKLNYLKNSKIVFSAPAIKEHGDLSVNIAMTMSKELKRNPREIANEIIENLNPDKSIVERVEIAGPGFINFFFSQQYAVGIIDKIINKKENFGKSNKYKGKKALVEFVSANPTGPLTVGHGRNAVIGDIIANILSWAGYSVNREYYFNNAGRQMRVLGDSVRLRYLKLLGTEIEFPEDYYQGEYISEIAKSIFSEFGDRYKDEPAEGYFKLRAEEEIFNDIKKTLFNLNIIFDSYFNEKSLYEEGRIDALLKIFESKNLIYTKDGAVWLKLTEMEGEQDKVMVKSTGEPTYRLPDIAYHLTKFERNYDLIIDVFGSDHNAAYPDVLAALKALGNDIERIKVLIHQFVTIYKDGQIVKMSTRKANYITIDDLIEDVGSDVVRYFFNMRSISAHLNFDLNLAKKQSDENPVFYLQYAHARISSIVKMAEGQGMAATLDNLNLLIEPEEIDLIKKLGHFEHELLYCADNFESNRIGDYLEELASLFHKFYAQHRVIGVDEKLSKARLALCIAVQIVLKNGLTVLGVNAPERM